MVLPPNHQITSLDTWKQHVLKHWETLKTQVDLLQLPDDYHGLLAIALLPIFPKTLDSTKKFIKLLGSEKQGKKLAKQSEEILAKSSPPDLKSFVNDLIASTLKEEHLDWLILTTGALAGSQSSKDKGKLFSKSLLSHLKGHNHPGIRVQAKMISSGENVIFAGRDVHFVKQYYEGDTEALEAYLGRVRSEGNYPDLGTILPTRTQQSVPLHEIFTPMDVWADDVYLESNEARINELRDHAVEKDLQDKRTSALEAVATYPLTVVLGSPGTGKSTFARYLATCLAYACDPESEKEDKINGLHLLGSSWIHGAILPIYVSLRDFCAYKKFPKTIADADAESLLKYLKYRFEGFAKYLESYLMNRRIPVHGVLLLLDGLDEVFEEGDKLKLQKIVNNWVKRFPRCRIVVTSRGYAYRRTVRWRFSSAFKIVELAPYSKSQVYKYVDHWYQQAAMLRPMSFGGDESARSESKRLAKDLKYTIEKEQLWSLARQPLLLALIVLIHEGYHRLPSGRAELYDETVELLHRWNMSSENDAAKLRLDPRLVRQCLQLVAFRLQSTDSTNRIQRGDLLAHLSSCKLSMTKKNTDPLRVLNYLATRNGILVSGRNESYRFLHLSIQEYLAARALIEQYNECKMPADLRPPDNFGWTFPANIIALLSYNPYRWRQVTLFVGSILAQNVGQDMRWNLIEHLLIAHEKYTVADKALNAAVAAEIWYEGQLEDRVPSHGDIRCKLQHALEEAIAKNNLLDAIEQSSSNHILVALKKVKPKCGSGASYKASPEIHRL